MAEDESIRFNADHFANYLAELFARSRGLVAKRKRWLVLIQAVELASLPDKKSIGQSTAKIIYYIDIESSLNTTVAAGAITLHAAGRHSNPTVRESSIFHFAQRAIRINWRSAPSFFLFVLRNA